MAQAHTLTEIEIRLFERPRKLPFRGRSFKTLSAFLRREGNRSGPWMGGIADGGGAPGRGGPPAVPPPPPRRRGRPAAAAQGRRRTEPRIAPPHRCGEPQRGPAPGPPPGGTERTTAGHVLPGAGGDGGR